MSFSHLINNRQHLPVIRDITFSVEQGTITCFVGPSGCGKTTILNLIAGLLPIQSGEIRFLENETQVLKPKIGFMFQRDLLFPWLTVLKNVTMAVTIRKEKANITVQMAEDLLTRYGLYDFKDAYPHQLSGGMRQRVALIRTMISDNKMLLFDEPMTGIDYGVRLRLEQDLFDYVSEKNIPALIVTHDIESAVALGDRIIIIGQRPGRIITTRECALARMFNGPIAARESAQFGMHFSEILRVYREVTTCQTG